MFKIKLDDWELLDVAKKNIKKFKAQSDELWFKIAGMLYSIWRDKAWKLEGCLTWSEWIAQNYTLLNREKRQIERLIKVWQVLIVDLKLPLIEVQTLNSTNAYEISRYIKKSNAKELIQFAKEQTTRDLRLTLKESNLEDMSSVMPFHCTHERQIVLFKCKECGLITYKPTDTTKTLIDKGDNIDKAKNADKVIVKDVPSIEP